MNRRRWVAIGTVLLVLAALLILAEHHILYPFVGTVAHGGVLPDTTLDVDPDDRMPVITSVRSDGAAARIGLQAGDEIVAIDGHAIHSVTDLRAAVGAAQDDAPLALRVLRGDTSRTVLLVRGTGGVASRLKNGAENPAD